MLCRLYHLVKKAVLVIRVDQSIVCDCIGVSNNFRGRLVLMDSYRNTLIADKRPSNKAPYARVYSYNTLNTGYILTMHLHLTLRMGALTGGQLNPYTICIKYPLSF